MNLAAQKIHCYFGSAVPHQDILRDPEACKAPNSAGYGHKLGTTGVRAGFEQGIEALEEHKDRGGIDLEDELMSGLHQMQIQESGNFVHTSSISLKSSMGVSEVSVLVLLATPIKHINLLRLYATNFKKGHSPALAITISTYPCRSRMRSATASFVCLSAAAHFVMWTLPCGSEAASVWSVGELAGSRTPAYTTTSGYLVANSLTSASPAHRSGEYPRRVA